VEHNSLRRSWQELAKMLANKELKAHVSLTFPFDEMAEAI